jgi:hypothetical protein
MIAALTFVLAITTQEHATTIKAFSRIACTLAAAVSSETAKSGDTVTLLVNDPSYPALRGAKINLHITQVTPQNGMLRASVGFIFDSIVFSNGLKEPIRANVIGENVTNRTANANPPASTAYSQAAPNVAGNGPAASTIAWQTQIGPKTHSTAQTGAVAYATKTGVPAAAPAGLPVTIELQSDLHTP